MVGSTESAMSASRGAGTHALADAVGEAGEQDKAPAKRGGRYSSLERAESE